MAGFDERDNVFSRYYLPPGSPEFERYYTEHPQLRAVDDEIRALPGLGSRTQAGDYGFVTSSDWLLQELGSPRLVDGAPAEKTINTTPERATLKVKQFARKLGADLVGVSRFNPDYAYSHRGRLHYPEEPWGSPLKVSHKFAVSLGFREDINLIRTAPYNSELVETGLIYLKSAVASVVLAAYIRSLGWPARAHHFRNYQLLSVPTAVDAGLGELARCGFLLSRDHGNCLRLSTVTTDIPLVADTPVDIGVQDFCSRCRICAEECPSGAIPKGDKVTVRGVLKWKVDAESCYRYWNRVGTDCGICIACCPWTQADNLLHRTSAKLASKSGFARRFLLWIYPLIYGRYRPERPPDWLDGNRSDGKV